MAQPPLSKCLPSYQTEQEKESNERIYRHYMDQVLALPSLKSITGHDEYLHNGRYARPIPLVGEMVAQQLFRAKPSDIILATFPKAGTTWLKSLLFATVNRNSAHYDPRRYLTTLSAHQCVPYIENQVYADNHVPDLELLPSPRLFATHMPSHSLPSSIPESGCKVVYLCRDVKDNFVSRWHFTNKIMAKMGKELVPVGEYFDWFCAATYCGGPFWDHVLGYWIASLERQDEILFLRYEEMMEDTRAELKKLAEFVGCPFTEDEEREGAVEDIVEMCSFENLSSLEVNKTGAAGVGIVDNSMLFRRGVVGDWANYLTPQMARHLDEITESKFKGSGLAF